MRSKYQAFLKLQLAVAAKKHHTKETTHITKKYMQD